MEEYWWSLSGVVSSSSREQLPLHLFRALYQILDGATAAQPSFIIVHLQHRIAFLSTKVYHNRLGLETTFQKHLLKRLSIKIEPYLCLPNNSCAAAINGLTGISRLQASLPSRYCPTVIARETDSEGEREGEAPSFPMETHAASREAIFSRSHKLRRIGERFGDFTGKVQQSYL